MLLGFARAVLGVRRGVRTALLVFAVSGTALCTVSGAALLLGAPPPALLALEVALLLAIAGGIVGLLRSLLLPTRDIAAYVDWRLGGGGVVMAAVERDGPFLQDARRTVKLGAALRYAAPFFPQWASAAILPLALTVLLASSSAAPDNAPGLLTLFMPGAATGGGAEQAVKASEKEKSGKRLVLVRRQSTGGARGAEPAAPSRLFAELRVPEKPVGPSAGSEDKGADMDGGNGDDEGKAAGGAGTADAAGNGDAAAVEGTMGGGTSALEIIDPEWAGIAERYLERLRQDR